VRILADDLAAMYSKRQKAEGRRQKVYYWYVVVSAIKESPNLYGDSYIMRHETIAT
jgi:hypothetical protein